MGNTPKKIKVRGAKVHNLKNINVDIPLNQIVAITGVSGSDALRTRSAAYRTGYFV